MKKYSSLGLLLVDDQKAARLLLKSFLGRIGVGKVEEATDSLEAMRILMQTGSAQSPFNALFISLEMREMTGLELIRNIRLLTGWTDIPIVVVSEDPDQTRVHESIAAGATEYLLRPYTEETLKAILDRISV